MTGRRSFGELDIEHFLHDTPPASPFYRPDSLSP
jgi:hypothetical protein